MTSCCREFHFAGWFFHHSFLHSLFSSLQCCSLYFRWGGTLGYRTIPSAEFILPFLSLLHILSFIDCIQQSPNGAVVRTCPLCWSDKLNWEFSNVWVVHTFLINRHEIHLPSFIWVTEVWIPPQPSGSSQSPWLIFSTVITPPSKSYVSAYNKHYTPKQADVSYLNLLTILFITASPPALLFLKTGHRRLQKATANFARDHTKSPALHRHLGTSQPERSQQWATQAKSNVRSYLLSKWATSQHHYGSSLYHRYWQINKNIPMHSWRCLQMLWRSWMWDWCW